ncbi:hypothetical protein C1H46_043558 [Malus baccata]|uniref:Uncharacterized protein n=1 Tax=Malus baccata TaxID=106549 RepID=A0A540K9N0_MALBA|nr:hypothetical protein C1H46_043558 [Malus baccata]
MAIFSQDSEGFLRGLSESSLKTFNSDSSIFFHKVSCKLLDSLAKLKLSFTKNSNENSKTTAEISSFQSLCMLPPAGWSRTHNN